MTMTVTQLDAQSAQLTRYEKSEADRTEAAQRKLDAIEAQRAGLQRQLERHGYECALVRGEPGVVDT